MLQKGRKRKEFRLLQQKLYQLQHIFSYYIIKLHIFAAPIRNPLGRQNMQFFTTQYKQYL